MDMIVFSKLSQPGVFRYLFTTSRTSGFDTDDSRLNLNWWSLRKICYAHSVSWSDLRYGNPKNWNYSVTSYYRNYMLMVSSKWYNKIYIFKYLLN